jgi:YVTN family beta-propeller protein
MNRRWTRLTAALTAALLATTGTWSVAAAQGSYEVWLVDQSNSRPDGGGRIHIYDGPSVSGRAAASAVPEVIDLGAEARDLCLDQTGTAPVRPHMLQFDAGDRYAVLAFVATGHVLFIEAASRQPVTCIDVGLQAHAAFPSPDGRYVIVANQNGKLLQRISTDFDTGTFALDHAATLDLANGLTPTGALRQDPSLRPDNAPICPIIDSTSRLSFVTLRGGGLFVVDITATPMAIVGEYDRATVRPNGCGGVESNGKIYITSGGGTAGTPYAADLYSCDLSAFATAPVAPAANEPALTTIFRSVDSQVADAHGAVLAKGDRYLWVGDRATNDVTVVDTRTDTVVNTIGLAGPLSGNPTPDIFDIAPSGNRIFAALRGPSPLTGNVPDAHNAEGDTPGLAVIRVTENGRSGVLQAIVRVSNVVDGVERADPHAVAVRQR